MKIWELDSPTVGDVIELIAPGVKTYGRVIEANGQDLVVEMLDESSGYIARNSQEAKDPRWSASLTVDVQTDTMQKQLAVFFPTAAPVDGQEQIKEAEYQGKEVVLGKPYHYKGSKKFYLYIRDSDTGKIIKVRFGRAHPKKVRRHGKKTAKRTKSYKGKRHG